MKPGEGGGRAHHAHSHPLPLGAKAQDRVTSPYPQSRQH